MPRNCYTLAAETPPHPIPNLALPGPPNVAKSLKPHARPTLEVLAVNGQGGGFPLLAINRLRGRARTPRRPIPPGHPASKSQRQEQILRPRIRKARAPNRHDHHGRGCDLHGAPYAAFAMGVVLASG